MRTTREEDDWRALVDEHVASGRTLREFCRDRGISRSSLSRWSRRFGHGRTPSRASRNKRTDESGRGHVVVELPAGIVVHVPAGSPPSFIAEVVAALTSLGARREERG